MTARETLAKVRAALADAACGDAQACRTGRAALEALDALDLGSSVTLQEKAREAAHALLLRMKLPCGFTVGGDLGDGWTQKPTDHAWHCNTVTAFYAEAYEAGRLAANVEAERESDEGK